MSHFRAGYMFPAGEFMLARYREVVSTVLNFKDARDKLVRRAAISLLPLLAGFAPERFAATYLDTCTAHLLTILRSPDERGVGESPQLRLQTWM